MTTDYLIDVLESIIPVILHDMSRSGNLVDTNYLLGKHDLAVDLLKLIKGDNELDDY